MLVTILLITSFLSYLISPCLNYNTLALHNSFIPEEKIVPLFYVSFQKWYKLKWEQNHLRLVSMQLVNYLEIMNFSFQVSVLSRLIFPSRQTEYKEELFSFFLAKLTYKTPLSVRPSVRPSVSPSVRQSPF